MWLTTLCMADGNKLHIGGMAYLEYGFNELLWCPVDANRH